jgi:hypothetical protein
MVQVQSASTVNQPASVTWQPVGPFQIDTSAWNLVSGAVTGIAADPSDRSGNTVYVGTAGGGVWKSTNAAGVAADVSFAPLTDTPSAYTSAALTSLSMGALSVQPGGTGVILAGTGDPNNAAHSWYGAGILRSADGGNHWSLIVETAASLSSSGLLYNFPGNAFAGFAWSTANPNLVIAAVTQSGYGAIIGAAGSQSILGLYYSPDAGVSWQMATVEDGSTVLQSPDLQNAGGNAATAVAWNPVRQRFYAAIRYHGYYESSDGITWTRLTNQPGANLSTANCPSNPTQVGSPACPIFRGALAVQPVTGDLFALTVDESNQDQGLWQDVCNLTSGACASGTVQFSRQIADQPLETGSGNTAIPNGGYDLWLAAVPSQQDTLLFTGTTDIWRCSLANSCAWRNTTNTQGCAAAEVAPAQQAVDSTLGASGLLYFGNEGGIWRTTDAVNQQAAVCSADDANHFQNLNGGIGSLAQVENFSEDPNNASTWLAALGPLGTAAPEQSATVWNQILDGEGDGTAIDPVHPDNWYATSIFGVGINLCTQGNSCDIAAFGNPAIGEAQVGNDVQTIPAPWILDPQNTANVILGTCRVWRGSATGVGWSQNNLLSGMLDRDQRTFCEGNAEIRSLAAAVVTPAIGTVNSGAEQIYVGMAGVFDGGGLMPGHIFTAAVNTGSQAASTVWTDLYSSPVTNGGASGSQFNPNAYDISSIYPDPHDATGQTVYVTIQGSSSLSLNEPLVYRSLDGGAHWIDITANLPRAPANSVLVDPNNPNIVYVALDTGVYVTQDVNSCVSIQAACWNVYGSGLPNAPVMSLMSYNDGSLQLLRAATWGRGIWQVGLATEGIPPTAASILPGSLTFSPQQVQTISPVQTVTIADTGASNLNITDIAVTGDFAETDYCSGQSLAPNASCQILVSFDPSQIGSRTGTLTVLANVAGGQLTASLTGTGSDPAAIVLTPPSLDFGATPVASASAAQFLTIANTSGVPVALDTETVSAEFSIAQNSCGNSLAAETSCTLSIAFLPAGSGSRTGQLTVVDQVGTQVALLSGTGQTAATDSLAPLSLTFAAQQAGTSSTPQPITLTNSGDSVLTGIAVASTGDFVVVNHCGTLLQGHGTCTIAVAYAPTVATPETGSLTVTDELRTQNVTLSGTGLAPPGFTALPTSVNFGGLAVGTTSSVQTVTVTNSSGFTLTGFTAAVSSGFAIASNNCSSTLGIGAACEIGLTFSPSAAGTGTGTLTMAAANYAKPLTVTLTGAGQDFSMAISGPSSAVLSSGQTATFVVQLTGLGGTVGNAAIACSGAPQNAACSLNPARIAIDGSNTSSVTVSITTGVSATAALHPGGGWKGLVSTLALAVPLWCAGFRRRNVKRTMVFLVLATLGLVLLAGCGVSASAGSSGSGSSGGGTGGSGGQQNLTPAGTYTITIAGTMSNITHSVSATLNVE